jgi:hypothetical protein
MKFRLTYSITTEASAVNGDHAHHGFVTRNKTIPFRTNMPKKPAEFRLREAVDFLMDRESEGPVEADSSHISRQYPPRWFSYGSKMRLHSGKWCSIEVSLHLPKTVTPSTAMRIARYLKCYGTREACKHGTSYRYACPECED